VKLTAWVEILLISLLSTCLPLSVRDENLMERFDEGLQLEWNIKLLQYTHTHHSIISQSPGHLHADRWLTGLIPISGVCWSGTFSMLVAKSCKPEQLLEINALDLSQLSMTTLWKTFTLALDVSKITNINLSHFKLRDRWKCCSVINMQCHHPLLQ